MNASNGLNPAARRKARRFALQGLYEWQLSGNPPWEIEARYRVENAMHKVDLDYFHDLLHGVPPESDALDALFTPHLDRDFAALDPVELATLRIGTFELKHRVDVPMRVVINEGIELAKTFGASESHKYINSILDQLARTLRPHELS
ncbi:NusB antitermination factor [Paraperlucidibaca baekdonensis]|uniref:Transcription antitermination protein NusB n=1 Tax=Paraperlucidibaca baekdonensis TaxID=748120 RepID=A0A3E0H853_9GAMM|nr:transcription antitermination factor NusB [Paraperlucidibaca baekdonensis]REH39899.1 NusB antitermination factor [Paraperlucidibaca baekdonensis]